MRLNLGCGGKKLLGYINIDRENNYSENKPDVVADIRKLPYEDNSVDEVLAIHVIEHFYLWEVEDVLKEWRRVLKPGGALIVELPCLEKIMYWLLTEPKIHMTLWGLYGDPGFKNPDMVHKWAYTSKQMAHLIRDTGFNEVAVEEAKFHVPKRDMRVTGKKRAD